MKKFLEEIDVIFIEINDQNHFSCFNDMYEKSFSSKNKYKIRILKKPETEQIINKANNIAQFGWKKEAIPIPKVSGSYISRMFRAIFN